jgi:mRNA-degrading endonuclease YafQ of YafQ-DinJ toxin-antitoxin module
VEVSFSSSFKRAFKKRIKLEQFTQEPFDPSLKTHRLSGKYKDLWSFSIDYDRRVLFYFTQDQKSVFVDVGNHDEVY